MRDTAGRPWPPFYFRRDGGFYTPNGLTRSPWDRNAIAGGPVGALLACGAEEALQPESFEVARLSIDILGKVPHQTLEMSVEPLRDGRQTKLHRITLQASGKTVAQAHVLQVRRAPTPSFLVPCDYPTPNTLPESDWLPHANMAGAIRAKRVAGSAREPGRGVGWMAMDGQILEGVAPSNFVKAALFADFGSGVGSATVAHEWSFANVDINLQFLRMPVGDWFLIDADTHMAGNGHASAVSVFADEQGVYARGFQTVFVAAGV
jgi:acyl-CoA thioesterase